MRASVVKIGGSLLTRPTLRAELASFFDSAPFDLSIIVAGGGSFVDVLRDLDQTHHIGESESHWLALDALRLTSRIVHGLLPNSSITSDIRAPLARLQDCAPGQVVFDPGQWLRETPKVAQQLPESWSVTSDTISAYLACTLNIPRLTLLKSAPLPPGNFAELAKAGFVDELFPIHSAALDVTVVCPFELT